MLHLSILKCSTLLGALVAGAVLAIIPAIASADAVIAYDNSSGITTFGGGGSPGLQNWGHNLGLDFTVNSPIFLSALGAFDNGSTSELNGVAGGGVAVAIFKLGGGLPLVTADFNPSSPGLSQINGDAFLPVSITLPAGSYSVVAYNDMNYNSVATPNSTSSEDGGGTPSSPLISFIGSGRYDYASSLAYPTTVDGGPTNRYDAGTFKFAAVPAPTAISGASVLLMFAASVIFLRKQRIA